MVGLAIELLQEVQTLQAQHLVRRQLVMRRGFEPSVGRARLAKITHHMVTLTDSQETTQTWVALFCP